MLNNIRRFSKTIFAKILLVIIIIPFVFWGMGGVFSRGNTNNLAKINNESISTQDFVNHINNLNVDFDKIKQNIENNIVEELLGELISQTMLSMEVKDLNLIITDKILNKKIKQNKNFLDENENFSRTKYEKFLLSSNLTAPRFEFRLRENELKKNLFSYISGGLNSPIFLINNTFKNQTKKLTIDYINLENTYKKKENFTDQEILKFIDDNNDSLKEKIISFKYSKITPKNLIGINDFNNLFFEKIDDIENKISNGTEIENIQNQYHLKTIFEKNFKLNNNTDLNNFYKKIYEHAEINKTDLLDENNFYILYKITDIEESLPDIKNVEFIASIKEKLFNKSKFELNNDIIKKIREKKFTDIDFNKISQNNFIKIKNIEINSVEDINIFTADSVKYLYTLSKKNFALVADKNKNIYIVKIKNISEKNISKGFEKFPLYKKQTNLKIQNTIYKSYDFYLNNKYKVKINEKTLERVKNYFR